MKNKKYQRFLYALLAAFVGVVLAISGAVFYAYAVDSMRDNVKKNQMQTNNKMAEWIDSTLKQADNMSIYANSSTSFMDQLKCISDGGETNYFDYHPQINAQFKNFLYTINTMKSVPGRVKLVTKWYDSTGTVHPYDYTPSKSVLKTFFSKYMSMGEYKQFIQPHKNIWASNGELVVSVVRPLRDNYSNVYGIIEIIIPVDEIDKIFKNYNMVLLGSDNKVIYSNANISDKLKQLLEDKHYDSKNGTIDSEKAGVVSSYSYVEEPNWVLVQYESTNEFSKPIRQLGGVILFIYAGALVVILGLLYLIIRNATKPIRKLTDIVKNASAMQTNIIIDRDEMQGDMEMLATSFQQMVSGIELRNKQITEAKLAESKIRIMALEAQLNPHFIYNTLAVIGAYGLNGTDDTVYKMCSDLSNMLRYSTDFTLRDTTLKEELAHTVKYMSLMEKRFDNIIEYEIIDNTGVSNIKLPKLIIQPLVENCFMHGLKTLKGGWHISIGAEVADKVWWVRVKDNGCGFSQEKIGYIIDAVNAGELMEGKRGIGLINTLLRIKLYYGDEGFYSIYNDNGAVVEVGGPIEDE